MRRPLPEFAGSGRSSTPLASGTVPRVLSVRPPELMHLSVAAMVTPGPDASIRNCSVKVPFL